MAIDDPIESTVAETELEAMRKHGHPEHPEHPDHPDHPHHPHHPDGGDDGDDNGTDTGDTEPDQPTEMPEDRHTAIAKLAYKFWQERGGGHSSHEQEHKDWLLAEIEYDSAHPSSTP